MSEWELRFSDLEIKVQRADQFTAHPMNARVHPVTQREAMTGSLNTLGWVDAVKVSKRTGLLLDGHERIWQALAKGDGTPVPYIEVDLDENEEQLFLATFDYITTMANYDKDALASLMEMVNTDDTALQSVISQMAEEFEIVTFDENKSQTDIAINEVFAIYIECKTEAEQVKLLDELNKRGLKCRALLA